MLYDLQHFGQREMIDAGRRLRDMGSGHLCMEGAAVSTVNFFNDHFGRQAAEGWESDFVLARCFKTHPLRDLPVELRRLVLGRQAVPETAQCLTLLASRGVEPEWNSRHSSKGHSAIPLATVEMVERAPMIRHLVLQLGMTLDDVVCPQADVRQTSRAFEVLHVQEARGSSVVPSQTDFVERYGVRSVLGFGGMLPAGELFAVLLFTRVPVGAATARLFRTLALGVKLSLLPFSRKRIFAENGLSGAGGASPFSERWIQK